MVTGTAAAQAIPILISPVLTRLYAPAEWGVYATFMFVAATIAAFASGNYQYAIMLPDDERGAANVLGVCLTTVAGVTALCCAFALGVSLAPHDLVAAVRIGDWVWLLPPMVLLQSGFETLNYWIIRKQRFRLLSTSRVLRAAMMAGANLLFGYASVPGGLIVSSLLGQLVATSVLAWQVLREDRAILSGIERAGMRELAHRHRHFPLYALPAEIVSTGATQLPVLFLDATSAGLFAFVQNVVNAPLTVVSGAVLDSFKERATRDYRETGRFRDILTKLGGALFLLGLPGAAVLFFAGPALFAFVFGEEWRAGGEYASILAIMFLAKFVANPLSYSYYIVERQQENLVLHTVFAGLTAAALGAGMYGFGSATVAIVLYSATYVVKYGLYAARAYIFSGGTPHRPS
jgi:O-antigen/teichoic acid export membrane protein